MAKTTVVTNARAFATWADDVSRSEAQGVMTAMSYTIDAARMEAADSIIPSTVPNRIILWSKGRAGAYTKSTTTGRLIRANNIQPSTAGRLTERTGMLQQTLRVKGHWEISPSRAKFEAPHWGINIRPQLKGRSLFFVANMRLLDQGPIRDMAGRILQEKTRGRPFLGPALQKVFSERIAPELIANIAGRLR